jgi:transcriptional regulator with XRE-family HTH domain
MPKRSAAEKDLPPFDLKAAREAKGWSQIQTAEFFTAGQSSVARWEADGSLPSIYRKYWALYWEHEALKAKQPRKSAKRKAA